jgi:L-asparaginase
MISIFTTGGTIDKIYFDANSQFSVGEPQAQSLLSEARVTVSTEIIPLLKEDSLDMTEDDRNFIADRVFQCSTEKIVIIHGTDSIVATAQTLASRGLITTKTIVLFGAMQPARMRSSDAPFNLGFAMAAVQLLHSGIYIAMNGRVFAHDQVVKNLKAGCFEYK